MKKHVQKTQQKQATKNKKHKYRQQKEEFINR